MPRHQTANLALSLHKELALRRAQKALKFTNPLESLRGNFFVTLCQLMIQKEFMVFAARGYSQRQAVVFLDYRIRLLKCLTSKMLNP